MGKKITISLCSQELINKYYATVNPPEQELPPVPKVLDLSELLQWFEPQHAYSKAKSVKLQKEREFILLSLHAQLLHDLSKSLASTEAENKPVVNNSWFSPKIKLILLSVAGILVAACEGFDSIVTIFSTFSLSATVILTSALIFSFLSTVAFCGLELIQLSQSLGIKLSDAHQLLDVYLQQLEEIKQLRKKIATYNLSELSVEELAQLEQIVAMLRQRFVQLDAASEHFERVLNNKAIHIAKFVLSSITAALFFGGSFCSGQTVALFILGLFMTTVSPLSAPVLLFSLAVGLAAFALYWAVEFPGLQSLVSGWFGLDEERVDALCNKALLAKEERKVDELYGKIVSARKLKEHYATYDESTTKANPAQPSPKPSTKVGENIYSLMRPKAPAPQEKKRGEDDYEPAARCSF